VAENLLVIKLGALGDFVQALGPMQAIRRHHADARITLLTTSLYVPLAEASGYVDSVWVDDRAPAFALGRHWAFRRRLTGAGFDRVYDLQTSDRSGWYFRLMTGAQPEWSGIAPGCSHPHANPERDHMHTIDRQAEQLAAAGIISVPAPDLSWFDAPVDALGVSSRFVLLAPGGAAHRPEKRWSVDQYAALASRLAAQGVQPVIVGGPEDAAAAAEIQRDCPDIHSLIGRTSLLELGGLARRAVAAVGNDTGPMHIAAGVGCRSVVLFSNASDPSLCAQRGPDVTILRRSSLDGLAVDEVEAAMRLG
jgi:ADP-heptose:LPS heptosyltransferase